MSRLEFVTWGHSRHTVLSGDEAIKVAKHRVGVVANRREFALWGMTQDSRLCPVLGISRDGAFLRMRRCEPYTEDYERPNVDDLACDIVGLNNWGILDGRAVLVDYGHPPADPNQPQPVKTIAGGRGRCQYAGELIPDQEMTTRLRPCALKMYGGKVEILGVCQECPKWKKEPASDPVAKKTRSPLPVVLPCDNEGAILEHCHSCQGDLKSVRECEVHEKSTRVYVSDKVVNCVVCQRDKMGYVPRAG